MLLTATNKPLRRGGRFRWKCGGVEAALRGRCMVGNATASADPDPRPQRGVGPRAS